MSVQYDATARTGGDNTGLVTTLGAASLGGTIGVRVIIDDAVLTSEVDARLAIMSILNLLGTQTWPVS